MRDDLTRLADVSKHQLGAVTAAQLHGVDAGRRWRRVHSGGIDRVGVRTYRSPFVPGVRALQPPHPRHRLRA
ncbi:MAG: hypothetical protein ACR2HQ_04685 [Ilumatobacteraceae bacterium]